MRVAFFCVAILVSSSTRHGRRPCLRCKARRDVAEVVLVELRAFVDLSGQEPMPRGLYGTNPIPSSSIVGGNSSSGHLHHNEYSLWTAVTGWIVRARHIVFSPASGKPRLPDCYFRVCASAFFAPFFQVTHSPYTSSFREVSHSTIAGSRCEKNALVAVSIAVILFMSTSDNLKFRTSMFSCMRSLRTDLASATTPR